MIGAPGGTQIAMGVVQVILNVIEFGMSAVEADVCAPRISSTSDAIDICQPGAAVRGHVNWRAMGYEVLRTHLSYAFGSVHAIKIDDGVCTGGADPNHDGMALSA